MTSRFFARTSSKIRWIVRMCDVNQFLWKPFGFFLRILNVIILVNIRVSNTLLAGHIQGSKPIRTAKDTHHFCFSPSKHSLHLLVLTVKRYKKMQWSSVFRRLDSQLCCLQRLRFMEELPASIFNLITQTQYIVRISGTTRHRFSLKIKQAFTAVKFSLLWSKSPYFTLTLHLLWMQIRSHLISI